MIAENTIKHISPDNTLKKGYTMTIRNGKIVKSAGQIKKGEILTLIFIDGKTDSKVI